MAGIIAGWALRMRALITLGRSRVPVRGRPDGRAGDVGGSSPAASASRRVRHSQVACPTPAGGSPVGRQCLAYGLPVPGGQAGGLPLPDRVEQAEVVGVGQVALAHRRGRQLLIGPVEDVGQHGQRVARVGRPVGRAAGRGRPARSASSMSWRASSVRLASPRTARRDLGRAG